MATVLELQICRLHPGEYEVRVVKAAAGGEPRAPLRLNVDELLAQRPELEDKVLASAAAARRAVPVSEQAVQRVGRQLFEALFVGLVSGTYRASLSVARERQERLQIVLRLEAPELTLLPWETLFDPHTDAYVCRHEPMVRHLPASFTPTPLPVEPPLRILVVIASPRGLPLLDTDAERERLEQALAPQVAAGRVELVWLTDASWQSLHAYLLDGPWHVLHFIGHGDYDVRSEEGLIALMGEGGGTQMVEASRLADLLGEADPAPRLMVLNSCASAQGGGDDGFSSVGAALVRGGISAVAAMQFAVSDRASVRFAQGFYTALAHGRRVDDAVRSGRISMLGASQSLEWITPVLYVRGEATLLFALPTPPPRTDGSRKIEESDHHNVRLGSLYVMARAELRIGDPGKAIELLDDLLILDPKHKDAIALRAEAVGQEQFIKLHAQATEAEKSEDWSVAIDSYEQILQTDPERKDAASRRDFCRNRQRIAHLQEEMRYHADADRWQTVLEISEELNQLDPTTTDPEGLATRAHQAMQEAQQTAELENLYTSARTAENSEYWTTAIHRYKKILQADPEYKDAASRRDFCRNRQRITLLQQKMRYHADAGRWQTVLEISEELNQLDPTTTDPEGLATRAHQAMQEAQQTAELENLYTSARIAENAEGWATAINNYEQILQTEPEYRDVLSRRDFCRNRQYITHLQQKMRHHADADRWQTVLDINEELNQLDPTTTDPEGLATRAHQAMQEAQNAAELENLYTSARAAENSEDWDTAISNYDTLLRDGLEYKDSAQRRKICLDRTRIAKPISDTRDETTVNPTEAVRITTPCGALAWDPSGRIIAVSTWGGARIRVYNSTGGERLNIRTGIMGDKSGPYALAFSPDGARLVSNVRTGGTIWNAFTGKKIFQVPANKGVTAAAFSPNGTLLATGAYDSIHIWDANTGKKIFWQPQRSVRSISFSPDGNQLAVADQDGLHIWDFFADRKIFEDRSRKDVLNTVAHSLDGTLLATSGKDHTTRLWVANAPIRQIHEFNHDSSVRSVAFSPDGTLLAAGCEDHITQIWDVFGARLICEITHGSPVRSVAFSSYGTRLATGTQRAVKVWELR
ncbi:CHAT domain-containing protein [Streptomyces sp. NBC_01275]|uniref:CHAT domain-containing protein n=1 Tax=Streptomyces sp. NBC_01275 TaxID=2903807 RepID=UPI00225A5464|nr:CHAT domain-containing protein [Streptomyces sp. NBC_01275]MCX4762323.1 CHAT domain-containing protein [Streptomyces sp. NBC_01275]